MNNVWNERGSVQYEKHESLRLELGKKIKVKFLDEGADVPKKVLADAGVQYPRDCHVFTVETKEGKKSWWVGQKAFGEVNQLKKLADENNGSIAGLDVEIERVSNKNTETNHTYTKV